MVLAFCILKVGCAEGFAPPLACTSPVGERNGDKKKDVAPIGRGPFLDGAREVEEAPPEPAARQDRRGRENADEVHVGQGQSHGTDVERSGKPRVARLYGDPRGVHDPVERRALEHQTCPVKPRVHEHPRDAAAHRPRHETRQCLRVYCHAVPTKSSFHAKKLIPHATT